MRVLFVATVGGFVPQFEMNDVKILKEYGCDIHYAADFNNPMYSYDEKILDEYGIIKHQVNLEKSPYKIIKNFKALIAIKKIIKKERIDIIHCHTPVGGVLARLAAQQKHRKLKVIYTAHGFHFYKGAPFRNWCIYYPVERFLAKKTDVIITINEEDYCLAQKFTLRENGKVYKIPGVGLDLNKFCPEVMDESYKDRNNENLNEKENLENKKNIISDKKENKENIKNTVLNKKDNKFEIITVGELNKNKNHKVIIEAIQLLNRNDIYYTVYGRGKNKEKLERLIKSMNLESYVCLKGYMSEPETVLKKADCFAFPSLREGLGMAALEAMACKLPIIAGDNRGTREYMKHGYNGIVCSSNDPKEYAKAIEFLAFNKEKRVYMGENARITAQSYGMKRTEEIMKQIYSTLISEM